jgi:hypothetical protein
MAITKLIADSITSGAIASTPAFEAKLNSDQFPSTDTNTKLSANGEIFDTDGCYNNTGSTVTLNGISTPAYSFAPNVAGKYYIFATILVNPTGINNLHRAYCFILKNDVSIALGQISSGSSHVGDFFSPSVGIITELNGTSDYVYAQGFGSNTSETLRFKGDTTEARTFFGAYRIIE